MNAATRISFVWSRQFLGLSGTYPSTGQTQVVVDSDGDGLSDSDEINVHGTDPNDADSDDELSDGYEIGVGRYISASLTWDNARADAVQ